MPVNHPSEMHQAFVAAVNAKDLDALLELYDVDGIAVHLDGAEYRGEEAMRSMLGGLLEAIDRIEGTTRKIYVAGDVALTSADWKGEFTAADGTVQTQTGTTAELCRRQPDGTWKMVIDDPTFT